MGPTQFQAFLSFLLALLIVGVAIALGTLLEAVFLRLAALWARTGKLSYLRALNASAMVTLINIMLMLMLLWIGSLERGPFDGSYPRSYPYGGPSSDFRTNAAYIALVSAFRFTSPMLWLAALVLLRAVVYGQVIRDADGNPLTFARACLVSLLQLAMNAIFYFIVGLVLAFAILAYLG